MKDIKFPEGLTVDSTYKEIGQVTQIIQAQIKDRDAALKAAKEELRLIQEELLPHKMNEEGVSTVNVNGIGRFTVTSVERVSVKGGCQPELKEWLRENEFGALIQDTINSSTLKAWVKEQLQEGNEVPTELLNMHSFERVTLTKK